MQAHVIKTYDWWDAATGEMGNYPSVKLAPGWWFCEECGAPMEARTIRVPCCGSGYDCEDDLDQPFCRKCDPPEPGAKDSYNRD